METKDNVHVFYSIRDDNQITCTLTYMPGYLNTPVSFNGIAKCHPQDIFNEKFGKRLAKTRAYRKLFKFNEKILLAESRQNSKHKNFPIAEDMLFDYGYVLDDIGINLIAKILDNAKLAKRIKI